MQLEVFRELPCVVDEILLDLDSTRLEAGSCSRNRDDAETAPPLAQADTGGEPTLA